MSQEFRIIGYWLGAFGAVGAGVLSWLPPQPASAHGARSLTSVLAAPPSTYTAFPDPSEIVRANPFRIDRRPAAPASLTPAVLQSDPFVAVPVPQLRVTGILGGPPWTVILTGMPGVEGGVVLSVGDSVGSLHVHRIGGDTVFVSFGDSTIALPTREVPR